MTCVSLGNRRGKMMQSQCTLHTLIAWEKLLPVGNQR